MDPQSSARLPADFRGLVTQMKAEAQAQRELDFDCSDIDNRQDGYYRNELFCNMRTLAATGDAVGVAVYDRNETATIAELTKTAIWLSRARMHILTLIQLLEDATGEVF